MLTSLEIEWTEASLADEFCRVLVEADTSRELTLAGVDGVSTRRPDIARVAFDDLFELDR